MKSYTLIPQFLLLQGYLGECVVGLQQSKCCLSHHTLQQNLFYHMVQHKIYCWRTFPQQHRVNCLLLRGWNQSGWYLLKLNLLFPHIPLLIKAKYVCYLCFPEVIVSISSTSPTTSYSSSMKYVHPRFIY